MSNKRDLSPWSVCLAGGVGGTIGALVTCPLEVVKTRLQSSTFKYAPIAKTSNPFLRILPIHCLHETVKLEGWRALWKGVGANLFGIIPARSIYFTVYEYAKRTFVQNESEETAMTHLMSAAAASFATSTITNPIWVVKTRIQIEKGGVSVSDSTAAIWKDQGLKGFYRGLSASYLGMSETIIQFVLYEQIRKRYFARDTDKESSLAGGSKEALRTLLAAGSAKVCATVASYPHEVMRTRLREPGNVYKGLLQGMQLIVKQEGMRGLYSGMGTHLLRTVPNSAIMFASYETVIYGIRVYGGSEEHST